MLLLSRGQGLGIPAAASPEPRARLFFPPPFPFASCPAQPAIPALVAQDNEAEKDGAATRDVLGLRKVLDAGDWWSPNAKSSVQAHSETQLLTLMHEGDKWHLAEQSWRGHLLPVGHWVSYPSENPRRLLFIVANLGHGALVWPAVLVDNDKQQFMWDPAAKKLEWAHGFDYDEVVVVSAKPVSPLHRRITRGEHASVRVCFTLGVAAKDSLKGLLQWHASRGFAGVPEAILRKVHKDIGAHELDDLAPKHECEVVLEVVRRFNPDLTEEEAQRLLCKRAETDCPDMALGELDCEMLRDVVLPKDHDDIVSLAAAQAEKKKRDRLILLC